MNRFVILAAISALTACKQRNFGTDSGSQMLGTDAPGAKEYCQEAENNAYMQESNYSSAQPEDKVKLYDSTKKAWESLLLCRAAMRGISLSIDRTSSCESISQRVLKADVNYRLAEPEQQIRLYDSVQKAWDEYYSCRTGAETTSQSNRECETLKGQALWSDVKFRLADPTNRENLAQKATQDWDIYARKCGR